VSNHPEWKDVEKMAYSIAWELRPKMKDLVEELVFEARSQFLKLEAENKFPNNKDVKFSTWFHNVCRNKMLNVLEKWDHKWMILSPLPECSPEKNDSYSLNLRKYGYGSELEDRGISEFVKRDMLSQGLKKIRPRLSKSERVVFDAMVERGEVSPSELTEHLDMSYGSIRTNMSRIRKIGNSIRNDEL